MNQNRRFVRSGIAAIAATTCGAFAMADVVTFESGQFVSGDQFETRGVFGDSLMLDRIDIGESSFNAMESELLTPSAVRIFVDRHGDGQWELLTDEALRSVDSPVTIAAGRDSTERATTALEAMSSLDMLRSLHIDGSARVRIDVLLTAPIHDNAPNDGDHAPECLVLGSTTLGETQVSAMIAGTLESPVFAPRAQALPAGSLISGQTGVTIVTDRQPNPYELGVLGFDLSDDFGVRAGITAIGYRVEVAPGASGVLNVLGSAGLDQIEAGLNDRLADLRTIELGGGGGAAGGFSSAGGAGGGSGGTSGVNDGSVGVRQLDGIPNARISQYDFRIRGARPFRGSRGDSSQNDLGFDDFFRFPPPPNGNGNGTGNNDNGGTNEPNDPGDEGNRRDRRNRRNRGNTGDDPPKRTNGDEGDPPPPDRPRDRDVPHTASDLATSSGDLKSETGGAGLLDIDRPITAPFIMPHDDRIIIHQNVPGTPVPGPAAIGVLAIAGLGVRRRRR